MANLVDTVLGSLGSGGLNTIAGQLGLTPDKAKVAVGTAVTVLTGALAHNASEPKGAQALDSALAKDHDGGILDNVTGFLGSLTSGPGPAILGHVFGSKQPTVEKAVADKSGLPLDKVVPLLAMVAPLVMGALGKMKKEKQLDAGQVADTLAKEKAAAAKKDSNGILDTVMDAIGGMASTGSSSSAGGGGGASGGGLGGILNTIGGLFKKKG